MSRNPFRQCSRALKCPICKASHQCMVSEDGNVAKCCKILEGPSVVKTGTDDGGPYAIHRISSHPVHYEPRKPEERTSSESTLTAGERSAVYECMLSFLTLKPNHQTKQYARGFTDEDNARIGCKSYPCEDVSLMLDTLQKRFSRDTLARIPGLYYDGETLRVVDGVEGLWIPVRTPTGHIVGIRIRTADEQKKYIWLSSTSKDGPSSGAHIHVPQWSDFTRSCDWTTARVTEGEFKAELATLRTGIPTVSIPGVGATSKLAPTLRTLGVKRALIAIDADKRGLNKFNNGPRPVLLALASLLVDLKEGGFDVSVEDWKPSSGKGIDDVLQNDAWDTVDRFDDEAAFELVAALLSEFGGVPKPELTAHCSEATQLKWKVAQTPAPQQFATFKAPWETAEPAVQPAAEPAPETPPVVEPPSVPDHTLQILDETSSIVPEVAPELPVVHLPPKGPPVPPAPPGGGGGGSGAGAPPVPPGGGPSPYALAILGAMGTKRQIEIARAAAIDLRGTSSVTPVYEGNYFWVYDDTRGVWVSHDNEDIRRMIFRYDGIPFGTNKILALANGEVDGILSILQTELRRRDFFKNARNGVVFRNGFMVLNNNGTIELLPLSPDHRQTFGFEFDWNPKADAQRYDQFMDDTFSLIETENMERQKHVHLLEEMAGAALFGMSIRFKSCLILTGFGSNGKSTFLDLVMSLFPTSGTCSMPPEYWGNPVFGMSLYQKRLNVVHELSQKAWQSDIFKKVVGGDSIPGDVKYGETFMFNPIAAQFLACNALPEMKDLSHGFLRRVTVVHFGRILADEDQDKDILEKLKAESAGVLVRFVHGAIRLMKQKGYTISAESARIKAEWKTSNDPLDLFCQDEVVRVDKPATAGAPLFERYMGWCEVNNVAALPSNKFRQAIERLLPKKHTNKGNLHYCLLREGTAGESAAEQQNFRRGTRRPRNQTASPN